MNNIQRCHLRECPQSILKKLPGHEQVAPFCTVVLCINDGCTAVQKADMMDCPPLKDPSQIYVHRLTDLSKAPPMDMTCIESVAQGFANLKLNQARHLSLAEAPFQSEIAFSISTKP